MRGNQTSWFWFCRAARGTGKVMRWRQSFAQGDKAEAAKAAGADIVGFEDLLGR